MKPDSDAFSYSLPPPGWISRLRRNLFIFRNASWIFRLLGAIGVRFVSWSNFAKALEANSRKYRAMANSEAATVEDVGYVGNEEVVAFLSYKHGVKSKAYVGTESEDVYRRTLESLPAILERGDVKKVLNFGVCYAHIDAELAKRFPNIEFHGVDRSPYTQLLNEDEFGAVPNMRFFAGDGFKLLEDGDYDMLLHVRTACVLSRPLVSRLYGSAQKAKVKYIAGFEQFGISHQTMEPYVFSTNEQDSVWWRGFMYIHNYPALLKNCGYQIVSHSFLETQHSDPDFRYFEWLARRS